MREASLEFSPKFNCFIGANGVGKTNILDAIYFLSFCHSAFTSQDSQVIRHDESLFMLEGVYGESLLETPDDFTISCGMKRGTKKHFKRDKKEYKRLSEHIGLIPIVMISPGDTLLIEGGSEERRRLMDMVISQLDVAYIESLNRYNKALQQRNMMLRREDVEPDPDVLAILEEQMAFEGEIIFGKRRDFIEQLTPLFKQFYTTVSGDHEKVSLEYVSHSSMVILCAVRDRRDSLRHLLLP